MKMDQIECFKTSAYRIQTSENHPKKEYIIQNKFKTRRKIEIKNLVLVFVGGILKLHGLNIFNSFNFK
jgi:hypothetical protein